METLKVPFGANILGELVSADDAKKGVQYLCPACSTRLTFKSGKIKSKHFAHSPDLNCSLETVLHQTAKHFVRQTIDDNATSKATIKLEGSCPDCLAKHTYEVPARTFSGAKEEIRVTNFVCDVVGYRGSEIALGIEILVTHTVDEVKALNLPIYWIELRAEDIISNPSMWRPVKANLRSIYCQECKSRFQHVCQVANRYEIDRRLYSPIWTSNTKAYIAAITHCYRCAEEIPVLWWKGGGFCEQKPPYPKPWTIQFRYTKTAGKAYWVNVCPNCGAIQGDYFLYYNYTGNMDDAPLGRITSIREAYLYDTHR